MSFESQKTRRTSTLDSEDQLQSEPVAQANEQQFTSHGRIPPVMTEFDDARPSASDLAFGDAGGSRMRVTTAALNVRTSPTTSAHDNIIGTVHHGAELETHGRSGHWVRTTHQGREAYVHGNYVQEIKNEGEPDPRAIKAVEQHVAKKADTAQDVDPIPAPAKTQEPPARQSAGSDHDSPAPAIAPATEHAPPDAGHDEHASTAAPTKPEKPEKPHAPLHGVADQAHHDVVQGKLAQHQAVQQVIEADHANGTQISDVAMGVVGGLLAMFGEDMKQKAQPAGVAAPNVSVTAPTTTTPTTTPTTPTTTTTTTPTTTSAPAAGTSYLAQYTSLGGTRMDQLNTTKDEATVLNGLRHKSERFDPAWLVKAQKHLGVTETGAMNTETLRKMLHDRPDLTADKIVADDQGYVSGLAPGKPFVLTETGFGEYGEKDRNAAKGATKADRGARRLGYKDYDTYYGELQTEVKFLGAKLKNGNLHPHLVQRLAVAEQWLRQRHPEAKTDEALWAAIGWSGVANASYDTDKSLGTSHFHTMGLAIDIDRTHNPYVFTGRHGDVNDKDQAKAKKAQGEDWWMSTWEKHTKHAATIYGGEGVSASKMAKLAEKMSSEELWAHIHETSESWRQYLVLAKNPTRAREQFAAHGLPTADLADLPKLNGWWHDNMSRGEANSLTNIGQELLVALRDVAGLSWGGAEMSSNENGDFMHFDCRHDTFGLHLFDFNNGR